MTKFEVSRKRGSGDGRNLAGEVLIGTGAGAGVGLFAAGLTGMFIGLVFADRLSREDFMLGVREVGVPIASITAFIGGFTSAAVFEVTNERGWEPVPLPLQIGLSPHGGVRVALRFEFGR